jgi:WD40 repeat protein
MANIAESPDDLATRYLELWENGQEPDARQFLTQAGRCTAVQIVAVFRVDQSERWRRRKGVAAEVYLQWCPALAQDPELALELIYGEYVVREQLGLKPALDEYLRRFPKHGPRLRQQVELHRALADVSEALTVAPPNGRAAGARDDTQASPTAARPPAPAPARPTIPGYQILGELGRGGMGVVYKAEQVKLKRVVALKMLLSGSAAGTTQLDRFRTEAESVARLQHPNIVQVYEVGDQSGLPYFSLEFCAGGSLAQRLDGTPLAPREAATLIETLARAMHVAHERGIIHRDLKPANVLFTSDNVPKIADFGLAKKIDDTAVLTQTGAVVGTPSYMAPEQAGGKGQEVGPPSDVYALGTMLYELLTGRPPFKAETPLETLLQVAGDEPVPPSRLQRKLTPDLETITLKCLEKAPNRRYTSAAALADDLRSFLHGEPIQARPVGWKVRLWKWVRRRPAVAALVFVSVAAALTLLIGGVTFNVQLREQRNLAYDEKKRADEQRSKAEENAKTAIQERLRADQRESDARQELDRARRSLFTAQLWRVAGVFDRDPIEALKLLHNEKDCPKELRDFSWGYYHHLCRHWQEGQLPGPGAIHALAVAPNGELVAAGSSDGTVKLWDFATRRERAHFRHAGAVQCLAFSQDSSLLASGSKDRVVKLWDVAADQEAATLEGCTGDVRDLAFSPDGKQLATATGNRDPKNNGDTRERDGEIRLWDVAGRKLDRVLLPKQDSAVPCLSFAPDGKTLACGFTHRSRVYVLDAVTGKKIRELYEGPGWVHSLCFSPNGRSIAWASAQNMIFVSDSGGKTRLKLRGHQGEVNGVVWSPDGALLASAAGDRCLKLWDTATGQERLSLELRDSTGALAFTPDGKTLLTGGGRVTLWSLDPRSQGTTYTHAKGFVTVALSADGTTLAGGLMDHRVKLWSMAPRKEIADLDVKNGEPTAVALSRDGARLAVAVRDYDSVKRVALDTGEWQLWDTATRTSKAGPKGTAPTAIAFLGDRQSFVTGDLLGQVRLWDANQQREITALGKHDGAVKTLALAANGTLLASCAASGVKVWDVVARVERQAMKAPSAVAALAFLDREGKTLVTVSTDRKLLLWDTSTGAQKAALPEPSVPIDALAVSGDGQTLALGCRDRSVRLIDVTSGQLRAILSGHSREVRALTFGPGDRFLVSASASGYSWFAKGGEVKIWDADR